MPTDADLVIAARKGDSAAFGKLVERYRDAAFGIAFHKLGDFEAARDAVQDAIIRAYTDLPTLRDPAKFANWFCRITLTASADLMRRKHSTVSLDEPGVPEPTAQTDPAAALERSEKARQVREALAVLSKPDKLTIILHYINGYSYQEIGDMLGATVSAVKSRIHRARGRLKEEMWEMIEQTLKQSVLEQLHLPRLDFAVTWEQYDHGYDDFLEIKITEVFGSSSVTRPGDSYLICGEYKLKEHAPLKEIKDIDPWLIKTYGDKISPQVITLFAAAIGTCTGYHCFLTPGSGEFATYVFVKEIKPGARDIIHLMVDSDKSRISIRLKN